ncbi:MAG TPA: Yip1 family protein [Hyphomonadaceae bacterium]|nr:Yip1 family protein [Hyphomonadaceae bacterium]
MLALVARVKNLLLSPGAEWEVIDREEAEPRKLALGYVAPLAAIPTIAIVIGLSVLGVQAGGQWQRAPIVGVLISAGLFFLLAVGGVFVFAFVINWLAPRFKATRNYRQAFKVAAYSITAAMVAGVLTVAPALGVVALLGATYSLYLLFVGAPKVMHAPPESAINYSIVVTFTAILLALVVGLATMLTAAPNGSLFPQLARFQPFGAPPPASAVAVVGPALMPASAGELADGNPPGIATGDLRDAAPPKLAGLDRVAVSVERRGLAGARTIDLGAEYRNGQRFVTLQIVLSKSIADTIGFGGPATSEYDRQTADGYSRRQRAGEAIISEDWDNASRTGSYGRLVDDSFYVRASGGGGILPADLRQVVELFGRQTLAQFEAER